MTEEQIRKANPEINPKRLKVGQQINLVVAEPYVHLESEEQVTFDEAIPFPVEVEKDETLWPWQEVVKERGVAGKRQVTITIKRNNGAVVDRQVIDTKILSEPQKQIVRRGTKIAPDRGTGSFRWPLVGTITSKYGYRWREFHDGVDIAAPTGTPIAVFADLQGPKIRTGVLKGDGLDLKYGAHYRLMLAKDTNEDDVIPIPHPEVMTVLQAGDILKLDDGKLQITIVERKADYVLGKADTPGRLTNRKGINLPGRALPISALTEKDRADLDHALKIGVDYVALSFVQRPEDVEEARAIIGNRAGIISKIEKPTAVDHLDAIIEKSDALMVARGDLGVELPAEDVPNIQRRIVRACRKAG